MLSLELRLLLCLLLGQLLGLSVLALNFSDLYALNFSAVEDDGAIGCLDLCNGRLIGYLNGLIDSTCVASVLVLLS